MDTQVIQILEMIAAVIAAIVAYWQNVQKRDALAAKEESESVTRLAHALKSGAEAELEDVVSFFDPADDSVTRPPGAVPARSWKMSDETKHWVVFDHPPDEQASLLKQIAEAEAARKSSYIISVAGCYYEIEYGLLKGGGKGKKTG
jgi:hypothetical protein